MERGAGVLLIVPGAGFAALLAFTTAAVVAHRAARRSAAER
ncbi:hypothetical protein [Streptomonospora salina]|uniref:Uncharacterized protein n=1 Tax=Streptomonospora salina TaxID=104205 RepID=A0A841E7V6_9ACTN|nr:hypothetical protein [Streptomonospora salina]MBB5997389.1 hypothetical protein [Streptomonospora salina]